MSEARVDDPCEELLAKAQTQELEIARQLRESVEADNRRRRALDAWNDLANFRGDAIPRELSGESLHRAYAERILELGRVLREDGWTEIISTLDPGNDAKKYALNMLYSAIEGDLEGVTRLFTGAMRNLFSLGLGVQEWLHDGLRCEVLNIELAPDPPPGWEGSYLNDVTTREEFVEWLDTQLLCYEGLGIRLQGTNGSLVRNAYRLIDQLDIPDVPPEPTGLRDTEDELAVLRNLRRQVISADYKAAAPEPELTGTARAVLQILREQPSEQGLFAKEITSELRKRGFEVTRTTLYRHVMPKLKADCGVEQSRARGGYYLPASKT